jgi:UDP-2-acetamido-2,6-beta-L-arabino-hexul-4-ose reductase
MLVKIDHIQTSADARGAVFEPLDEAELSRQRNVHVVLTRPGAVRGNHYHRSGTEVIVVHGCCLARFRKGEELCDTTVGENETVRFYIPHGVSHAFKNTGSGISVMVACNTVAHDPVNPDVTRDVLIEP